MRCIAQMLKVSAPEVLNVRRANQHKKEKRKEREEGGKSIEEKKKNET